MYRKLVFELAKTDKTGLSAKTSFEVDKNWFLNQQTTVLGTTKKQF